MYSSTALRGQAGNCRHPVQGLSKGGKTAVLWCSPPHSQVTSKKKSELNVGELEGALPGVGSVVAFPPCEVRVIPQCCWCLQKGNQPPSWQLSGGGQHQHICPYWSGQWYESGDDEFGENLKISSLGPHSKINRKRTSHSIFSYAWIFILIQ